MFIARDDPVFYYNELGEKIKYCLMIFHQALVAFTHSHVQCPLVIFHLSVPSVKRLELMCFKFTPPQGHTHADVLSMAHWMRVEKGDYAISYNHPVDAISKLTEKKFKITA
jgi:hypothetical protein